MRAILLARAMATTLNGRRASSLVIQGYFSGFCLETVLKMPILDSPIWANMIHALDVDKTEPWPDGQDRQKDQALSVGFDG